MKRLAALLTTLIIALILAAPAAQAETLLMATTTSTDNTGLLDYLAPLFQEATGIELQWTAVGTGKALELGQNCDVDVLLVHAPAAEMAYVEAGHGVDRRLVMYNDFVIIGPADDPAGVAGMSVADALATIASKAAIFVSRGDDSGTHKKELSLWGAANMEVPDGQDWYVQTGQGMMPTINMAAEKMGYTMTDRGTYITYESEQGGEPPLKILVEGDEVLFNQYSVISVNPERCENVHYDLAQQFADWIVSDAAQAAIADYKLLGKQLFTPNAE